MSTKVSRFLTLGFVFSIALVLVFSSSTSAFQVSLNVQRVWSNFFTKNITWTYDNGSTYVNSNITGAKTIKSITFTSMPNSSGCQANDIYEFTFMLRNWTNDNSSDINIDNMGTSQNAWEFMGANVSQANASTGLLQLYLLKTVSGVNCGQADFTIPNGSSQGNLIELHTNETIEFSVANIFRPVSDTNYTSNFQAVVNAIQNTPDYSTDLNNIIGGIDDLQRSQAQANQDANDRYEDEKDTITDSRDEAQSSANSMDTSGFTFSNPFTTFFALFTDNVCVSIPTIASWIHSNETQVCSPWRGNNVRSVLTPVFAILSNLIITGFVIRWLSSGNKEGTIEGI